MQNLVSPMELYNAARETCMRLFIANGGNPRDQWKIQPYPGTAAISSEIAWGTRNTRVWTLCMPSMPLDKKVTRGVAELIAGYTVHELLHALWTDWSVVQSARYAGLSMLLNAIEDTRIEGKASRGALKLVSEARRLLNILNSHVYDKARAKPQFNLADERQFAFILTLVIFSEKLGYTSAFPKDWRKHVSQRMLPLYDMALARYDALASTADSLQLAHDLTAAAKALPPVQPTQPAPAEGDDAEGNDAEGDDVEGNDAEGAGNGEGSEESETDKGEGSEGDDADDADDAEGEGSEGDDADDADDAEGEGSEGDDADDADDAEGEGSASEGGGATQDAAEGDADAGKGEGSAGDDKAAGEPSGASQSEAANGGGRGSEGGEVTPPPALDDRNQDYSEVSLDDLGDKTARSECGQASMSVNAGKPHADNGNFNGTANDARHAGAAIATPAKLKRHVTLAVKATARTHYDRFQISGRLDMRNLAGIALKSENVYKKRTETKGKEAAVTLLLDASSSMGGVRIAAARAMALHMGDALKAAGVKFEIASFKDSRGCAMAWQKEMGKPWNEEARGAVAGIMAQAGTAMLPAIKECAARLAKAQRVTRRILLVLTDGEDHFSPRANALNIRFWRARGIETLGIGLMLESHEKLTIADSFDNRVVFVDDCAKLAATGMSELVRLLADSEARP